MSITIYTATGCTRCKIVKAFMKEKKIAYEEKDMKAQGKEEFQAFYKENRNAIFRGPDGIEFPILTDGIEIRQGISASIGYLHSGKILDGFFSVGTLHKEWVDGIHISGGEEKFSDDFLQVLSYLKSNNMKLQAETNGKNSNILEQILSKQLIDIMIMNVIGPPEIYHKVLDDKINMDDVKKSLSIITQFPQYKIQTTILPLIRDDGQVSYLTPQEIAETAKLISEGTGSNKVPYIIKTFNSTDKNSTTFQTLDSLPAEQLLSCRTKARAYQVFTEIEKV